MAVTKTLTVAVPFNKDGKVEIWDFEMKYEEGEDATYFSSAFSATILATDHQGNVNFTPKAEGEWTLAQLTALCPTSKWDDVFDIQYDSVITNPPNNPVADPDYVIPES
jgi:hypothetical protein